MNLFNSMIKYDCQNLIFSSSASIYGENRKSDENDKINPSNPYASTKVAIELLMQSVSIAHPNFTFIALRQNLIFFIYLFNNRYFNPAGAH